MALSISKEQEQVKKMEVLVVSKSITKTPKPMCESPVLRWNLTLLKSPNEGFRLLGVLFPCLKKKWRVSWGYPLQLSSP